MTTPKAIREILEWQQRHEGQVPYSESAGSRLYYSSEHLLTATDCSGMAARMFRHFAGITPGTYTGNECSYGKLITRDKSHMQHRMLPGDVILFDWDGGNWDHIAIYAGDGRIWNHGGPGYGPLNWSLQNSVDRAVQIMVRRWLEPVAPSPKKLHRQWPSYMGEGDYFGISAHGSHDHHGAHAFARPDIEAIKHRLHSLGYGGMTLDSGVFGHGTKAAVAAWQEKHYPSNTEHFGEVRASDWRRLFSW